MMLSWALAAILAVPADDPPAGKKGGQFAGKAAGKIPSFAELDKNGDGKITKDEATGPLARLFDRIDRDHDGAISEAEFNAFKALAQKARAKMGKGDGAAMPADKESTGADAKKPDDAPPGKPGAGKPGKNAAAKKGAAGKLGEMKGKMDDMFARMDTDGDGKISKAEAKGPLLQRFDQLDANKDGFLSKEEVRAGFQAMAAKGGGAARGPLADFHEQDADGDGRVSKAEAKGTLRERFAELDTNGDGFLTRQEVEAGAAGGTPEEPVRGKKKGKN